MAEPPLDLLQSLGLAPFRPRSPWLTGDLQTLRDSLRGVVLPVSTGISMDIQLDTPPQPQPQSQSQSQLQLQPQLQPQPKPQPHPHLAPSRQNQPGDRLLAVHDPPLGGGGQCREWGEALGLVLLLHGLGGSSEREGLRRMGLTLQHAGFAVLRLNLRGAGAGRALARGTYAARCNRDVLPVIARARQLAGGVPLLGVGISLGGTMLLNALLAAAEERQGAGLSPEGPLLDGLVCLSSPLDLEACSLQMEKPRNRLYRRWLLRRLVQQTLADPFGVSQAERAALEGHGPHGPLRGIRAFDAAITAPRWGYPDVDTYYRQASPLPALLGGGAAAASLPPTLLVHAADDPWVPVLSCQQLEAHRLAGLAPPSLSVLITAHGGHNGFHGRGDGRGAGHGDGGAGEPGCWGDRLTARWLRRLVAIGGSVTGGVASGTAARSLGL